MWRLQIAAICTPRWVGRVITVTLTGEDPADLRLSWEIDQAARDRLAEEVFGNASEWTNHDDWAVGEVVAAYRCQADAEDGFR